MQGKMRFNLICTSAAVKKFPLYVVRKSDNPLCFLLKNTPLPYTNQINYWFDC